MSMRLRAQDGAAAAPLGIAGWRWQGGDVEPGLDSSEQADWWIHHAPTADPATYRVAPLPEGLRVQGAALALSRARADVLGGLDPDSQQAIIRARARLRRWQLRTSPFVVWLLGPPAAMDERTQAAKALLDEFDRHATARSKDHYGVWEDALRTAAIDRAGALVPPAAPDAPVNTSGGVTERPLTLAEISGMIMRARSGAPLGADPAAAETLVGETLVGETLVGETLVGETLVRETLVRETRVSSAGGMGADDPPPKGPQAKPSELDPAAVEAGRQGVAAAVRTLQEWPRFEEYGRQEAVLNGLICERARRALAAGDGAWVDHLQQVLAEQQILTARYGDPDCRGLVEWCRRDPVAAGNAFRMLWEEENLERALDGFCAMVPLDKEALGNNSIAQVASVLVCGRDPYNLPPLQAHSQDLAKICGLPTIANSAPVGRRYRLMLDNLRTLRDDLGTRGVQVHDLAGMYGVSVYVGNPRFLDYDTAPAGARFDALYRDLVSLHRANGGRRFVERQSERDPSVRREDGA